jgi:hypothetical protein
MVGQSTLPLRVRFAPPNKCLAGAIGVKINIPYVKCHQLTTAGKGLVSHAEHGAFSVCAQALAGTSDKFFDFLPVQRMGLILARRSFACHLLKPEPNRLARARIQKARGACDNCNYHANQLWIPLGMPRASTGDVGAGVNDATSERCTGGR